MNLSKGSILEFILGIFFIMVAFNTGELISALICCIGGLVVCWHCIYLWSKKSKDKNEEKNPKQKKNKNYWLYIQLPAYYVGIVITILYLGVGFFDLMGYNTWLSCILAICYGYAIYKIILKLAKHEE